MMKPQPTHHVILVFAVYGPLKQSLLPPRSCQCVALYEISLPLLLGIKNTVKFSIKIPHLTSTVHRFLSDRLLC